MININLGDTIDIDGVKGIVVCSMDNNEYSIKYSKEDWSYLKKGILVETEDMGLIHVEDTNFTRIEKN